MKSPVTSRRSVLAAIGATGLSGCLDITDTLGSSDHPATDYEWSMLGRDGQSTRHAPEASPITSSPELAWSVEAGDAGIPVLDASSTYITAPEGNVRSLALDSGAVRWERSFKHDFFASASVTQDGVLVADVEGTVRALDPTDGDTRWEQQIGVFPNSPVTHEGVAYFVTQTVSDSVVALTTADGERSWTAEIDASQDIIGSPAIDGPRLFTNTSTGVRAYDTETGTEYWRWDGEERIRMSPTVQNGQVVVATEPGTVVALAAETGELRWRYDCGGIIRSLGGLSSLSATEETLFVGTVDGTLFALAHDGNERYRNSGYGVINSSPALVDGTAYLGDSYGDIRALNIADGTERWKISFDRPIRAPLVATENLILDHGVGVNCLKATNEPSARI